ncbi:molybdate ABC transporter permease protein ModB [Rodentibacter pneumotropicus]|uniref:Molybdate ABC transporter permease protein ModB n=1 Tax=Rodentibacter pneumotropicus TaxID=758 RepID=A0A3S4U1G3_9PAST|nr:molybdate ABC transporter permease protein ModB [Rodentibacter pneumotropicus]
MLTQFLSLFNLSPLETDAIRLSLSVAFNAVLWCLPPAIFVAWILARKIFMVSP